MPARPGPSAWTTAKRWGLAMLRAPESLANLGPVRRLRERVGSLPDRSWFLLVVGLGLAVRIALAPFTQETDVETFAESSVTMAYGGGAYTYLIVYPPGWIDLLNLLGRSVQLFTPADGILLVNPTLLRLTMLYGPIFPTAMNVTAYTLLEKSLLWMGDLLISGLIYQIVQESTGSKRAARLGFALWFLNPLVITVSSVHGAYDVLPSLFAVGSLFLLIHRYPVSSGAALGVGVLLKLFPVFLVGLVAAVLLRQAGGRFRDFLVGGVAWLAGFGGILLVTLWPPGILSDYVISATTGPSIGESFGGFWIYSLTSVPGASGFRNWIFLHTAEVGLLTGAITLVAVALIAVVYWRRSTVPDRMTPRLACACFASIAVSYTALAVTQPQYLIWTLPWLILVATLDRRLLLTVLWISGLTLAFYYVGLEGPYFLFLPVAQFTPWLSYSTVAASVMAWQAEISTIRTVVEVAVFAALAFALARTLLTLAARDRVGT